MARDGRSRRGGGSVFYDKSDRVWRAQISVEGKRRTVGRASDRDGATALLNAYLAGEVALSGAPPSPPGPSAPLGERLVWWRDVIFPTRGRSPSTAESYGRAVAKLVDGLGSIRPNDLTAEHVENFYRELAEGGLARSSIATGVHAVLVQVLKECERRGEVDRNVARFAAIPGAVEETERRALTAEECRHLLDVVDGREYGHLFALALLTGARRNELIGLSWSAIDLEAGTMTIRQALQRREGGGWQFGLPKSARRRARAIRTIRLGELAIGHLRARQADQLLENAAARVWVNDRDLVFTTATGRHLDPRRVDRKWTEAAEAAGLPGVVLHVLRHTCGSHALKAGMPPVVVAEQLGHTVEMLLATYTHPTAPVVEGVGGVMDALLGNGASAP